MGEFIRLDWIRILNNFTLFCLLLLSFGDKIHPFSSFSTAHQNQLNGSPLKLANRYNLRLASSLNGPIWQAGPLATRRVGRLIFFGGNHVGRGLQDDYVVSRENKMNDLFDDLRDYSAVDKSTSFYELPNYNSLEKIPTSSTTNYHELSSSSSHQQPTMEPSALGSMVSSAGIDNPLKDSSPSLVSDDIEIMKNNHLSIVPSSSTWPTGNSEDTLSAHSSGLGLHNSGGQNSRHYSSNKFKPNYVFNNNHHHPNQLSSSKYYNANSGKLLYLNQNLNHNYNSNYLISGSYHHPPPKLSQGSTSSNNNAFHHMPSSGQSNLGYMSQLSGGTFGGQHDIADKLQNNLLLQQPTHQYQTLANNHQLISNYISASSAFSGAANSIGSSSSVSPSGKQESTTVSMDNAVDIDDIEPSASLAKVSTMKEQPGQQPFHSSGPSLADHQPVSDLPGWDTCGRQQVSTTSAAREPRIVGGNSTFEGEFPWAVSIQRHGNHHCGGVIVGRRWILTAAHCVRSQLVGNLLVRTGGHTLQHGTSSAASSSSLTQNSLTGHLERDYQVDQIVMHDDFNRLDNLQPSNAATGFGSGQSNNGHGNMMKSAANTANNADIALLRLKHDIYLNEFAWPVCFPARQAGNFSGHDAIVIGWGKLNEKSEEFSNELQKVKLTIIDNKVCQNWFRLAGREMPIDDRIICAGFKQGGKDACHGDSGGPLLSRMSNGQYVVVGVVSTGIGCARPLLPGLYSRVSSYISWIERNMLA